MEVIEVTDLLREELAVYSCLTENQLKGENNGDGLFIAESPKVIKVALETGYKPVSLLCERKHIEGDAAEIIASVPGLKVFTGSRELLSQLTGYKLTRGVLCAMERKKPVEAMEICEKGNRIAVIEGVCDTTNIGSIFRSAAALGIDGILLTPGSCDPLNRRAVRVSMGTVFKIPWTFVEDPVTVLKQKGFLTLALVLDKDSLNIDDPLFKRRDKLAMVLGTEGDGLTRGIITKCDYKVTIPMFHDVDSLNVGAASAVAFWELRKI